MENTGHYLQLFKSSAEQLDDTPFSQKQLEVKVGVWVDSVVLKIQQPAWLNPSPQGKPFSESIFFSIWVNDHTITEGKVYYNIHALKLRELTAYKIKSRDFADAFRLKFEPCEKDWPNVSTSYGPLTLMEGWIPLANENLTGEIAALANKFAAIAFMIDELLAERKK